MADITGWIAVVTEDIGAAHNCAGGSPPALRSAAYHCQQAAEKIVKGWLVLRGREPERTHDIERLVALLAATGPLPDGLTGLVHFTPFATEYRYPPEDTPPPEPPAVAEVLEWCAILADHCGSLAAAARGR